MKAKYHGCAGVLFFVLSFAGIVLYGIYLADHMKSSIKIAQPPAPASQIKIPDAATMAYIEYLIPLLTSLSQLTNSASPVDLTLFGTEPGLPERAPISTPVSRKTSVVQISPVAPVDPIPLVARKTQATQKMPAARKTHVARKTQVAVRPSAPEIKKNHAFVTFDYTLTLSLVAANHRYCVIDGKIYKENAKMDDGAIILKIENDRVLILKMNKKQWVYALQ